MSESAVILMAFLVLVLAVVLFTAWGIHCENKKDKRRAELRAQKEREDAKWLEFEMGRPKYAIRAVLNDGRTIDSLPIDPGFERHRGLRFSFYLERKTSREYAMARATDVTSGAVPLCIGNTFYPKESILSVEVVKHEGN